MIRPRLVCTCLVMMGHTLVEPARAVEPLWSLWAQSSSLERGPGFYLNPWLLLPVLGIFLMWVATTHWVEKDTRELKNVRYEMWNSIAFFSGILGFVLLWLIPIYFLGLVMLLVAYLAPLFSYIHVRNQMVDEYDKVLTGYHLGEVMNSLLALVNIKPVFNRGEERVDRAATPVYFLGKSAGGGADDPARVEKAEESEQYLTAKDLVFDAVTRRATDIHIEPAGESMQVRYRIDGILHAAEPYDRATGDALINIFKVLSAMDIAERRKPQDGSFAAKVESREVDFRVATSGSKGGEKMVIRILDNATTVTKLDEIGMRPKMVQQLREQLALPTGAILCAGPTGSGKSTTMYACLREIDRFLRNVVTVEDPIEYQIDNVTQIEVNPKADQTFSSILKSVLRQDPDIIMIGEIRDEETASIACQAAMTGHLVLSTVHANDAVAAISRMFDLKVEPANLAQSLACILSQRLVRLLCEDCKEPYKPRPDILEKAGLPADKVDVFYRPPEEPEQVCPTCGGTGFLGRTGIFELLMVTDPIRELIRQRASLNAIKSEARKNGMIYLLEDGLRQVIQGRTSIKELQRVVS